MQKEPLQIFSYKTRVGASSINYAFLVADLKYTDSFFFFNIKFNSKTDSHKEVFIGLKSNGSNHRRCRMMISVQYLVQKSQSEKCSGDIYPLLASLMPFPKMFPPVLSNTEM